VPSSASRLQAPFDGQPIVTDSGLPLAVGQVSKLEPTIVKFLRIIADKVIM
jgi:hypothetical protein